MLNGWPVNTIQPTTYGVRRHVQMLCQRGLADDTTFPVVIDQLLQPEQRPRPLAGIRVATLPFGPVATLNFGLSFHSIFAFACRYAMAKNAFVTAK